MRVRFESIEPLAARPDPDQSNVIFTLIHSLTGRVESGCVRAADEFTDGLTTGEFLDCIGIVDPVEDDQGDAYPALVRLDIGDTSLRLR